MAGVNSVVVDLATDKFTVIYDAATVDADAMQASIVEIGFRPSLVSSDTNFKAQVKSSHIPDLISEALREASEQGQLVFIDFYASWCGACRELEEKTLSDLSVKSLLSGYVVVKIDTDEHPSIGKYFDIVGLPTLLVMRSSGEKLYRHAGPIDPEPLIKDLSELSTD